MLKRLPVVSFPLVFVQLMYDKPYFVLQVATVAKATVKVSLHLTCLLVLAPSKDCQNLAQTQILLPQLMSMNDSWFSISLQKMVACAPEQIRGDRTEIWGSDLELGVAGNKTTLGSGQVLSDRSRKL